MSKLVLTGLGLREGRWHGVVEGGGTKPPVLDVRHLDQVLAGVEVTKRAEGGLLVSVPVPVEALNDGVQSFVICAEGEVLGAFEIAAGAVLDGELRAEVALLRAELDLLKAAFRRHCAEQDGD